MTRLAYFGKCYLITALGAKESKQWVTVALLVSATGTKAKPIFIWRSENPLCLCLVLISLFYLSVIQNNNYNHTISVADALIFKLTPDETNFKLLFKQGHSPSRAHFEYEQVLVDKNINSKISDIYNI